MTLAYNTTHFGYQPIGEDAPCYGQNGGCGYDALNVGIDNPGNPSLTTGTQPAPHGVYFDSAAGEPEFTPWAFGQPLFRVTEASRTPVSADECKKGGGRAQRPDLPQPGRLRELGSQRQVTTP